jgi:hypothetical protein
MNQASSESPEEFQVNFQKMMTHQQLLPIIRKVATHITERSFMTVGEFFEYATDLEVQQLYQVSDGLIEQIQSFTAESEIEEYPAIMQIFTLAMLLRHGEGDPIMNFDSIYTGAILLSQYLAIENLIRNTPDIPKEKIDEARKKYTIIDYKKY